MRNVVGNFNHDRFGKEIVKKEYSDFWAMQDSVDTKKTLSVIVLIDIKIWVECGSKLFWRD